MLSLKHLCEPTHVTGFRPCELSRLPPTRVDPRPYRQVPPFGQPAKGGEIFVGAQTALTALEPADQLPVGRCARLRPFHCVAKQLELEPQLMEPLSLGIVPYFTKQLGERLSVERPDAVGRGEIVGHLPVANGVNRCAHRGECIGMSQSGTFLSEGVGSPPEILLRSLRSSQPIFKHLEASKPARARDLASEVISRLMATDHFQPSL